MEHAALSAIAGILLSLLFSYGPKVKDLYEKQDRQTKQLVMLGLTTLAAVGVWGFGCYGQLPPGFEGVSCDQGGFWSLFWSWAAAIVSNVATYANTKYIGRGS